MRWTSIVRRGTLQEAQVFLDVGFFGCHTPKAPQAVAVQNAIAPELAPNRLATFDAGWLFHILPLEVWFWLAEDPNLVWGTVRTLHGFPLLLSNAALCLCLLFCEEDGLVRLPRTLTQKLPLINLIRCAAIVLRGARQYSSIVGNPFLGVADEPTSLVCTEDPAFSTDLSPHRLTTFFPGFLLAVLTLKLREARSHQPQGAMFLGIF
mmetsp:Transcript_5015/g.11510  ORF Transcript_5015/g.11510 Transcript_5015/m.11510 type:complete len:207 (-) Transcript_5015:347-967(-)